MASSSPFLQNSSLESQCEVFIINFCSEENIDGKLGFLTSLTNNILPNVSLFEVEAVYLAKVVPKICDVVLGSLSKITNNLTNLLDDGGNEGTINEIHTHLKGINYCMECLEKCALHISKLSHNQLSIKQVHSLHPGAMKIIKAAFSHCKNSESLYGSFFQSFSEDLANLFKKTFQLQKALMELIEKVQLDSNAHTEEVKEMTGVCHDLLQLTVLIGDIDVGLLVNTWKVLCRLVAKHKAVIKNEVKVEQVVMSLMDSVKSKLNLCLSMAAVKEGQNPDDVEFTDTIEAKSFTKMLRVVRFLMGILMQIVKEYCEELCAAMKDLLLLLVSLYSSIPPSLSAFDIIPSTLPDISSSILVVVQPFLQVLVSDNSFVSCTTRRSLINDSSISSYGLCMVLLDIAAILPGESDEVFASWMNPTTFPEEEPRLSLLQAVMDVTKRCSVELKLPVYVDDIMCGGKPARKVSLYEHVITHLSALIACSSASCFPFIEKCLVDGLLSKELMSTLITMDLWTFTARWESSDLCSKHVHFLICLMRDLQDSGSLYFHISVLVRRLACLLAKDHQEKLLTSFPPSKPENLSLWSVLPIKEFPENIQSKVCRTAVQTCIKQCNEGINSMPHALCCLVTIYGISNVQRLVPPVHHAAVIDIIASIWTKYNQPSFKLNQKSWIIVVELTGLLIPYIQQDLYARILRCLETLLNQHKTVDVKVAVAQFLGKCGTKDVLPDYETGVFGSIAGLFTSLISDESWIVYQISLQSVKAFAEVTPYTHIMGDCVPERLLPSLSDFLSNVPYKQEELSRNKNLWLQELLESQVIVEDQAKNILDDNKIAEKDLTTIPEPVRKRIKRDDTDINQINPRYSSIIQTLKSQLDILNDMRVKYPPNKDVIQQIQDIHVMLTNYLNADKVSENN